MRGRAGGVGHAREKSRGRRRVPRTVSGGVEKGVLADCGVVHPRRAWFDVGTEACVGARELNRAVPRSVVAHCRCAPHSALTAGRRRYVDRVVPAVVARASRRGASEEWTRRCNGVA